jgi:prepilin-type processing-associated H-X9-DG protein
MKKILPVIAFLFSTANAFSQVVALDFDGVNDQVVVSGTSSLCPTQITLETWMYAKSFSSSPCADCAPILWHQGKGYRFGTGNGGGVNVQFFDGSSTITLTSAITLSKNAWHHLAVTYDSAMIKIYVDGSLTDSMAKTFTLSYSSKAVSYTHLTLPTSP